MDLDKTGVALESLATFRLFAVRIAMMLTVVAAIVIYPLFGRAASIGLLMGGVAGALVFWITARRLEKVARQGSNMLISVPPTWRLVGFMVFALVLARAYTLDREGLSGLIAAAVGLFIIRLAAVALGVTGLDLPKEEE